MSALLAGINHAAAAVVVLTWVGLRCARRVNAATRYWIWTAVLCFLLLLPFLPGAVACARTKLAARARGPCGYSLFGLRRQGGS